MTPEGAVGSAPFHPAAKVRARREMPTSSPGGGFRREKPLSVEPFPRGKSCRIRSGPLLKMLPMERRKTMLRLGVVSPVPRPIFHLLLPSPCCHLRSICCPFFSRLSRDEVRRYKSCSVVVFEVYGLFLRFLPCVYRASAIRVSANPPRYKNEDNGRSLVVAPALCIQLVSANQYVRKTTKQRACKTVRQ